MFSSSVFILHFRDSTTIFLFNYRLSVMFACLRIQLTLTLTSLALAPPPQDQMKAFNCNRQFFCAILTDRCCSVVGHVFDADTVVFYDTDLNPSMDARTQEWCDKVGRSKDIHIYRSVYCRERKDSFFFFNGFNNEIHQSGITL